MNEPKDCEILVSPDHEIKQQNHHQEVKKKCHCNFSKCFPCAIIFCSCFGSIFFAILALSLIVAEIGLFVTGLVLCVYVNPNFIIMTIVAIVPGPIVLLGSALIFFTFSRSCGSFCCEYYTGAIC